MPKLLILLSSDDGALRSIVDQVVQGAESVKFTETEVRQLGGIASTGAGSPPRYRTLAGAEEIAEYHAVVAGVAGTGGQVPEPLSQVLAALRGSVGQAGGPARLHDLVASAFVAAPRSAEGQAVLWATVTALSKAGAIVVSPSMLTDDGAPELAAAGRELGKRVATVAEWVRHARSHEHAEKHGQSHSHSHTHKGEG
jgi:hypothetical protein